MGIFTDIIDDMKDRGQYGGMNVGWSSISPKIRHSNRHKEIFTSLGISAPNTVRDIGNIMFLNTSESLIGQCGKIELVLNWKYLTEKRKNELMLLRRKMRFDGSKISIDSSLNELDLAHKSILEILSGEADMSQTKCEDQETDNEFLQSFGQELLIRLVDYIRNVDDEKIVKNIIADMKYLVAIILQERNEEEEYESSIYSYVTYLQKNGLKYQDKDCRNCSIDVLFDDYKYCLVCGKRKS